MPSDSTLANHLADGVTELGLETTDIQFDQLLQYLALLQRWNGSFNLTSVRDPLQMVHRHILDSLSVLSVVSLDRERCIDVGTGAGLPGVPIAIMRPGVTMDLLDSNSKKTRFLFQVKTQLGLDTMSILHQRVEGWNPRKRYDLVFSRAFASLSDMVSSCRHLCRDQGKLVAMKGVLQHNELACVADKALIESTQRLNVPGLEEERHLITIRPLLAVSAEAHNEETL